LHLGLLVDTSASQGRVLGDERTAGIKFFDQILRPDMDQAFVLHFDYDIELLQDFTPSRQKLDAALNLLEVGLAPKYPQQTQQPPSTQQPGNGYPPGNYPPNQRYPQGSGYPQSQGSSRGGGGTKLYDAVLLAAEDMMAKQEGRKALIILTDGVDTGSKVTLYQAITAAQKADTLVYSVLFADDEAYGSPGYPPSMGRRRGMGTPMPMPPRQDPNLPDGKKVLKQLADETGGSFNQVSTFHKIDRIFADIQEELRNQYNLGYIPETTAEAGSFRHIHVTAHAKKKTGLTVKARAGYYVG
jgi:VWFA-related protein